MALLADGGGANYGWPIVEGTECFDADTCDMDGMTEPAIAEWHRGLCAIVGGPYYRGSAIPEVQGHVFYADFCVGWIRAAEYEAGGFQEAVEWSEDFSTPAGMVTGLGQDANGEMLVVNSGGELFRIVPVRTP